MTGKLNPDLMMPAGEQLLFPPDLSIGDPFPPFVYSLTLCIPAQLFSVRIRLIHNP